MKKVVFFLYSRKLLELVNCCNLFVIALLGSEAGIGCLGVCFVCFFGLLEEKVISSNCFLQVTCVLDDKS